MTYAERAARRQKMVHAVVAGESPKDVAARYGVSVATVFRALNEHHVHVRDLPGFPFPRHRPPRPVGPNRSKAVRLRRAGWPLTAIAAHLGITTERVRQILQVAMPEYRGWDDLGIDRMTSGRPRRVYQPGELYCGRVVVRDEGRTLVLRCPCGAEITRNRLGARSRALLCRTCRRPTQKHAAAVIRDYDAGLPWRAISARNGVSERVISLILRRNGRQPGDRNKGRTWSSLDPRWDRFHLLAPATRS